MVENNVDIAVKLHDSVTAPMQKMASNFRGVLEKMTSALAGQGRKMSFMMAAWLARASIVPFIQKMNEAAFGELQTIKAIQATTGSSMQQATQWFGILDDLTTNLTDPKIDQDAFQQLGLHMMQLGIFSQDAFKGLTSMAAMAGQSIGTLDSAITAMATDPKRGIRTLLKALPELSQKKNYEELQGLLGKKLTDLNPDDLLPLVLAMGKLAKDHGWTNFAWQINTTTQAALNLGRNFSDLLGEFIKIGIANKSMIHLFEKLGKTFKDIDGNFPQWSKQHPKLTRFIADLWDAFEVFSVLLGGLIAVNIATIILGFSVGGLTKMWRGAIWIITAARDAFILLRDAMIGADIAAVANPIGAAIVLGLAAIAAVAYVVYKIFNLNIESWNKFTASIKNSQLGAFFDMIKLAVKGIKLIIDGLIKSVEVLIDLFTGNISLEKLFTARGQGMGAWEALKASDTGLLTTSNAQALQALGGRTTHQAIGKVVVEAKEGSKIVHQEGGETINQGQSYIYGPSFKFGM